MNNRQIEYVLAVARQGSITAAAKRLYISQPALSQAIKQIENEIGASLFDRSTDPISLTFAGRRYVDAAQRILDIERGLRQEITGSEGAVHASMRLGISNQRGLEILPLVVPRFSKLYPYVRLNLIEHGSDTLERLTVEGECDIALVTTNRRSVRLEYVLIESEEVVLMAAVDTQLARRHPEEKPLDITEAYGERFVSMLEGHSVRLVQDKLFEQHRISPHILMETANMEAGKLVAACSEAVMLIPRVYVENNPQLRSRVRCYPILGNDSERHFYFCYRQGMRLTPYMTDFARITCEQLGVPFSMPFKGDAPIPIHEVRPNGE